MKNGFLAILAAGTIALASVLSPATASAASEVVVAQADYKGKNYGGKIYRDPNLNRGWHDERPRDRDRHHGRRHDRWGSCSPHEAVRKADRMGLRKAGIARISERAILVSGYSWRHRASVAFDRNSRNCQVIGVHGL